MVLKKILCFYLSDLPQGVCDVDLTSVGFDYPSTEVKRSIEKISDSLIESLDLYLTNMGSSRLLNLCMIDTEGRDHANVSQETFLQVWFGSEPYQRHTAKLEGLEGFSKDLKTLCNEVAKAFDHDGSVSIHLFKAHKQSVSFNTHRDPVDLLLVVLDGVKTMVVSSKDHESGTSRLIYNEIGKGQCLFLPKNTPHQAVNSNASIMLSIGLESD